MKKFIVIVFLLGINSLYAQQQDSTINHLVKILEIKVQQQEVAIKNLYSELNKEYRTYQIVKEDLNQSIIDKQKDVIDSLNAFIEVSNQKLAAINQRLDSKIQQTDLSATTKIADLNRNLSKSQLYWILGTLATLLLVVLVVWLLRKSIASSKTDVETQIQKTKVALEEESVKLDGKLVEILETQLRLQQEETKTFSITTSENEDHSLALKVADEIVRMQKNISRMDENTKGLKPLEKGIQRIQANFAANGYEMVNLLNTEYEDRMNIDVINFLEDENLVKGRKLISKVIKPQVNYNGILIQRAQVEVSQN